MHSVVEEKNILFRILISRAQGVKGKKENRVPEKIFTAEVLQDLGLQSTSRK